MAQRARRAAAACVLSAIAALGGGAEAPGRRPLEYEVKAVFLLRIAQFTEWPARRASPDPGMFRFCLAGVDPFGALLDEVVSGERIGGRPAEVHRLESGDEMGDCDLLFISASLRSSTRKIIARLAGAPTLTVADFDGFVGEGGAVELYVENGFVRFRIDRAAARAAGLDMRSQLLRAASDVEAR